MTVAEIRAFARELNRIVQVHDMKAWNAAFQRLRTMTEAERDRVSHYQLMETRLANRRAVRANRSVIARRPDYPYPGLRWVCSRDRDDGESVNRRYWIAGHANALALMDELQPDRDTSPYSPTGRWFLTSPSMKRVRDDIYIVQSRSMLDC